MHILNRLKIELKAAVEAGGPSEETFYKEWSEDQRKSYIDEHPNSRFAQEKESGNKPTETKPTQKPIQETTRKYTPQEESDLIQNLKKENIDLSDIESPTKDMIKIGLISKPNELKYLKDPVALKNLKSILDPENNDGQRDKILYNYMSTNSPYSNKENWNKLLEVSPSCIEDLKDLSENLKDSFYGTDQRVVREFQDFLNSRKDSSSDKAIKEDQNVPEVNETSRPTSKEYKDSYNTYKRGNSYYDENSEDDLHDAFFESFLVDLDDQSGCDTSDVDVNDVNALIEKKMTLDQFVKKYGGEKASDSNKGELDAILDHFNTNLRLW